MSNLYLSYKELIQLSTFEERFEYLKLGAIIGDETFGFNRYLNQALYQSSEWKRARRNAIIRDDGCDLGMCDRSIYGQIIVHHINPITEEDIIERRENLFDMDNLICVSRATHNALHYGDIAQTQSSEPHERFAGDTKLW